jgi:ferredoxin--NADP+ reductase
VTREPGTPKRYVQDVIVDGTLAGLLGGVLDPTDTHVYACGNPAMIGLPTIDGDGLVTYPEVVGACQLLLEMGFTLDHRGVAGNIHYEEYW